MGLLDFPSLQLGARGAAIDLLFYARAADGTRSPQPLTDANEPESFALFRKPELLNGAPDIVKVPIVIADADGGRARYVTEDGFLDQAGTWFAQGFVSFGDTPSSSFIPSEVVRLVVKANLRAFMPRPIVTPSPATLPVGAPAVSRT